MGDTVGRIQNIKHTILINRQKISQFLTKPVYFAQNQPFHITVYQKEKRSAGVALEGESENPSHAGNKVRKRWDHYQQSKLGCQC